MKKVLLQRVYVLESASGLTKVGITNKIKRRIREIETASGHKITKQWYTNAHIKAASIESMAHEALADSRKEGEWFDIEFSKAAEVVSYIANKVAGLPRNLLKYRKIKNYPKYSKPFTVKLYSEERFKEEDYKQSPRYKFETIKDMMALGVVAAFVVMVTIANFGKSGIVTSIGTLVSLTLIYLIITHRSRRKHKFEAFVRNEKNSHYKEQQLKIAKFHSQYPRGDPRMKNIHMHRAMSQFGINAS